jgi:16S rRNA (guanine(527)-N(7))-methyltransferase RsmG
MGSPLPFIPRPTFERELGRCAPVPLPSTAVDALWIHYEELRRWNPRLSLIGPGTASEVISRHYGEALAALPLLHLPAHRKPAVLVDIGSGAGFPGFVLAATVPDLEVTLVEPRSRKCAFLQSVLRKTSLPCTCLNGRVSLPLPQDLPKAIDLLTLRALRLPQAVLAALTERCRPRAQALLWLGGDDPALPVQWRRGREVPLAGSRQRRILEMIVNPKDPVESER